MSRLLKVAVKAGLQPFSNKMLSRPQFKAFATSRGIFTARQDCESSKTSAKDTQFLKENQREDPDLYEMAAKIEQDTRILRRKLTDIDQFRREMSSVGKEIFLANMDTRIFSYPDILPNDRYFELENKWKMVTDKLIEKEDIFEESMRTDARPPKDLLFDLRKIGFYGFMCSTDYGGSALSYTEALRLQEELASFDLSLSEVVSMPHTIAHKAIQAFGTKEQKDRYLEKMASGELISALCFCESGCGSDFTSSKASTIMSDNNQHFVLNGEKTWVSNAPGADLFLVFANHYAVTQGSSRAYPTAYLVERGFNGVTVHKDKRVSTRGLHGVEICSVTFENTQIPTENVLKGIGEGVEVFTNLFHDQRLSASARMCGALRKLINYTVSRTLMRKAHGNPLSFYEVVKGRLSEASCYLYVLESAIYMTAGIADYQKSQDTNLEAAMVKYFAIKATDVICNHCLEIFGSSGYIQDSPILQLVNDLKAYSTWEGTSNILGFYIALTGIDYAGKCRAEDVDVMRNKGRTPLQALAIYKKQLNLTRKKPKLTLRLGDDLHYHLSDSSDVLEEFLLRFGGALFQAMTREGYNLSLRELELERIANISTYIYVLASTLARASRSFSTGHPHSDFEMMIGDMFVSHSSDEIKNQLDLLFRRETSKIDSTMFRMSEIMTTQGRYPAVHPITKNTF